MLQAEGRLAKNEGSFVLEAKPARFSITNKSYGVGELTMALCRKATWPAASFHAVMFYTRSDLMAKSSS